MKSDKEIWLEGLEKVGRARPIIKGLKKCFVLEDQIQFVIGADDEKEVWEYTDQEIIEEAKYVQSKYDEDIGFDEFDMMMGEYGKDDQKIARKEYNEVKRFIKKWGNKNEKI